MKELKPETVEASDLLRETFNFWFADRDHIRSPFPAYIRDELERKASKQFFEWAAAIPLKAKDELNEALVAEKLEEIMFSLALDMVVEEDEKITLRYPFLPRIGDKVSGQHVREHGQDSVVEARILISENDCLFLKLTLKNQSDGQSWETRIELPPT